MAKPVSTMITRYTHTELGQDVDYFSGYYTPEKELRLEYNGREVLAVIGKAIVESSCSGLDDHCTSSSWRYAVIPGYVVSWQNARSEAGLLVSETEPILEKEAQEDIRQILETGEGASLIDFWQA